MEETNASTEPRHAEFELKQDHERGTPASRSGESDTDTSDTDSDEHDKGNSGPSFTSRIEERVADSDEEDKEPSVLASTSKNEERYTDSSSESSSGDVEIEQDETYISSGDLPTDVADLQTFTEEEEEEKDKGESDGDTNIQEIKSSPDAIAAEPSLPINGVVEASPETVAETSVDSNEQLLGDNAAAPISTPEEINMQEAQKNPEALAVEHQEESLPIDEVGRGSMEIVTETADDLDKQVLGDNAEVLASTSEDRNEGDQSVKLQSLKASTDEENKPSSSQTDATRDIAPESAKLDKHSLHDPLEAEDEHVKKGFTCDGNTEEDNEEQLREYWMRTLQTTTSTGEIVEEIVKVLKHHQKSHDLLCPVCGSCVTRRVILRKRKRSSLISVDRWYRDPIDEAEGQEQGSSLEPLGALEEQATQEYHDTEAFGCLSCFSLFFEKGRRLLNRLQADVGPDNFNCLPFFFPPYPWGMTQMKPRSPGMDEEAASVEVTEELEEPSTTDMRSSFSCGIGSTLLPDYPWGTMPLLSKGLNEESSTSDEAEAAAVLNVQEEAAVPDVQESLTTAEHLDYTCGIGSTLLPDYPWGTMPSVSKGEATQPSNQTDTVEVEQVQDVSQSEDIQEISQPFLKERTCTCGLAPALLPAYPWGFCTKSESSGEQIQGSAISDAIERQQPPMNEPTCTCGLAQALLPDYSWGYLSKVEDVAPQSLPVMDTAPIDSSTTLQAVSQHEISEEVPELHREERNCTCGLVPALLPDYPWGSFVKNEGAYYMPTPSVPQAPQTVEETEGKGAEDKRSSCNVVSAVLPDYPWGMTTESEEVLEEEPTLCENRKSRSESIQNIGSAILPLYPWGVCSQNQSIHDQNGNAPVLQGAADKDCTCGLAPAMWPKFPWGQTLSTVDKQDQTGIQEVKSYIEQETKIEARITSKTDVFTVTSSKTTYPGQKPPQNIKSMIPQETSQTIKHVKLDQTVTIIDASVRVEEVPAIKGSSLVSIPSTGYALLDLVEEGSEKGRLETTSSTGFAHLEEISEEAEPTGKDTLQRPPQKQIKPSKASFSPTRPELEDHKQEPPESEIKEDPMSVKYSHPETKSENYSQSFPEETFYKPGKTRPQLQPVGTQFPSFQWSVGKLDAGDLTTPLLKASVEPEGETVISVLKPSPEPKNENWLSVFKVSKPSDEEGIKAPLLSTTGYIEEIEEVKLPAARPQITSITEAVIDVPPGDSGGTSVGTATSTAAAVPAKQKKEADGWDILKSIVYGGLDISVASLGVTSSAAGGNAITRTVVYMGLATLLSGLIGFYHNVLNLYHYHRDHYTDIVGVTLMLHGTVALISFVVFGLLSPLIYAFSYRETDNRDDKFILCCVVTIVAVTALALGKAKVSNKRYLRTLFAYLLGGVLAAIVGYLTGEHVAELLEEWGI